MDSNFGRHSFAAKLCSDDFGSWSKPALGAYNNSDITFRLDFPRTSSPYSSSSKGTERKWDYVNGVKILEDASLALGLGRSPSSSDNSKGSSLTVCTMSSPKETTDDESSVDVGLNFELHLGSFNVYSPKNPSIAATKVLEPGPNLELCLSTGPSESLITSITSVSARHQDTMETPVMISPKLSVDEEGSASSQMKIGCHLVHSLYASDISAGFPLDPAITTKSDTVFPDHSSTLIQTMNNAFQRNSSMKSCQFQGCGKGARGASGLCIAHGGGRRCQKAGCHKGAEGRTVYCKAHGGGRRCQYLGCTKSAEGRTDYCIAHGGGRRCSYEGCVRAARGKSGLCIRHGGGKRCQRENCTKSAEGYSGLCISHGGGRRCQFQGCSKGAQGSTALCKAHGGGKRCIVLGCTKGAEGSTAFCKGHGGGKRCSYQGGNVCPKSVHGGTWFCVAHGGGKRCAVPECTKSARGRTDFCVRHGGGKRCKFEGCGKSAQGSTDFCKAHGGGKRCCWGQAGSDCGVGSSSCDRFARGKTGLCAAHNAMVQDRCVHGGRKLGPFTKSSSPIKPEKIKEIIVEGDICTKIGIVEGTFTSWGGVDDSMEFHPMKPPQSRPVLIPEGRVHGGSLMSMLSNNSSIEYRSQDPVEAGASVPGMQLPYTLIHHWM